MSIVINGNTTKIKEMEESVFTPKIIGVIIVAFLAGVFSVSLFAYTNKTTVLKMLFPSYQNNPSITKISMEDIPVCISRDIKSASDKDFIVYSLKYNEMMKPRLQSLLTKLSDEKYKALVNSAIAHQEKETQIMKSLYKAETKKEYVSANEKASLIGAIPFPEDILSQKGFTDEERMSLLRAIFENVGRSYYSVIASVTKNTALKENATNFFTFKADFVKKMTAK